MQDLASTARKPTTVLFAQQSLASAAGSIESGFIFAALGFNAMAYVSAGIAVIPLVASVLWFFGQARPPLAAQG